MVLNKKILSLMFSYALIANLTSSKPVSSHFVQDVAEYGLVASSGIPIGAIAEPVLVGLPTAFITAYKSVKERPINKHKFKKILKSAANKSFKAIKWGSGILLGLFWGLIIYNNVCVEHKNECHCGLEWLVYGATSSAIGAVGGLSWLGQKLTESKEDNFKNENKKEANQK